MRSISSTFFRIRTVKQRVVARIFRVIDLEVASLDQSRGVPAAAKSEKCAEKDGERKERERCVDRADARWRRMNERLCSSSASFEVKRSSLV